MKPLDNLQFMHLADTLNPEWFTITWLVDRTVEIILNMKRQADKFPIQQIDIIIFIIILYTNEKWEKGFVCPFVRLFAALTSSSLTSAQRR